MDFLASAVDKQLVCRAFCDRGDPVAADWFLGVAGGRFLAAAFRIPFVIRQAEPEPEGNALGASKAVFSCIGRTV